jgi:hypothetical protein
VRIGDQCAAGRRFAWDREGMLLVNDTDGALEAPDPLRGEDHYPQVARLLTAVTGARRVIVYNYVVRSSTVLSMGEKKENEREVKQILAKRLSGSPLRRHASRTPRASTSDHCTRAMQRTLARGGYAVTTLLAVRLRRIRSSRLASAQRRQHGARPRPGPRDAGAPGPDESVDEVLKKRYAVLNYWRPTNGPVEQLPLAICDKTSLSPDDLLAARLQWPGHVDHTFAVTYNPRQRRFHAPALTPREVLVFCGFDSAATDGHHCNCHSAFVDPRSAAGAKRRDSFEARAIVLF